MSGYHKRDWETFPMDKIKRVDRPTTMIDEAKVKRVREREGGFMKAAAGDYGPVLQREFRRFVPKHPLSGALAWMRNAMRPLVDGMVAARKRPCPRTRAPSPATSRRLPTSCGPMRSASASSPLTRFTATGSISLTPPPGNRPSSLTDKYAIAVLIDQDYRTSRAYTGSDWISNAMSMLSYTTSGFHRDHPRRLHQEARLSGEGALCALLRRRASAHPSHGGPGRDEQDRRLGAPSLPRTPLQGRGGHHRPSASCRTSPSTSAFRTFAPNVRNAPGNVRAGP